MLELNTIYHKDCFAFLSEIDNNVIDLAIVDPPYNMKKADWDTFKSEKAFFEWTFSWIDALLPKLKEISSLYVFNTPYNNAFILQYLVSKKMKFQNWITWDKRDGLGASKTKYSNGQESILFFTKSAKHTFNYEEIRVPYESTERMQHAEKTGILKDGKRWYPNPNGRFCGEVWHFSSERHKTKINGRVQKQEHITPKPLGLVERMVKASSNEGDIILDCFVGSGTSAVAAKKLNRQFVCADSCKEFVELAQTKVGTV